MDETFWLNLTNFGLAALCAICGLVITWGVVRDLVERRKRALATIVQLEPLDAHAFEVPGLGLTMADGGTPIEPVPGEGRPGAAADPRQP